MNARQWIMHLNRMNPDAEVHLVCSPPEESTCQMFDVQEFVRHDNQTVILLVETDGIVDV